MAKNNKEYDILHVIRHGRSISKFDIVKKTQLNKTTVGTVIEDLIHRGLVKEVDLGESCGGRKPVLLGLNPEAGYAIGVDFEATSIRTVLVNFVGDIVSTVVGKIEYKDRKLTIVKKIIDTIHELIKKSGIDSDNILGIGIGVPGIVDSTKGISVSYYTLPYWQDVNIGDLVRYEFGLPTYIEKNIRTMALAEKWFGQGHDINNFICVGLRSGMGLGIIIDGKLFRGSSEAAGEIGHVTFNRTGPRCRCGNKGCLQEYVSGRAILSKFQKQLKKGRRSDIERLINGNINNITLEMIIQAAREKDDLALEIINESAEYLGINVANIINLFNPELVILAGFLVDAGDLILKQIRKTVEERALEVSRQNLRIELSELGDNISALGASVLILCENMEILNTIMEKTGD